MTRRPRVDVVPAGMIHLCAAIQYARHSSRRFDDLCAQTAGLRPQITDGACTGYAARALDNSLVHVFFAGAALAVHHIRGGDAPTCMMSIPLPAALRRAMQQECADANAA